MITAPAPWRNRIVGEGVQPASQFLANPLNARRHPQVQRDAVKASLNELGWIQRVIVNRRTGFLVDGHDRIWQALQNGDAPVPYVEVDLSPEEEALALAVYDPISALATTDAAALDALLRECNTGEAALQELMAKLAEDAKLYDGPTAEVVEDEAPPTPAEPITKPGDLWLLGRHRLLCGDSTKAEDVARLMAGAKMNLAFTSPPYASQREYDESSGFRPIPPDDYVRWWEPIQENVKRHLAGDGSFFVNIKPCAEGLDTHLYVFDLVSSHVREWGWHFATEFCWERNGVPKSVTRRFKNQFEPIYQFTLGEWKMRPDEVRHPSADVPMSLGKGSGNTGWAGRQGSGGVIPSNRRPKKRPNGGHGGWGGKATEDAHGTNWQPGEYTAAGMAYPGNRLPTFTSSHEALGHTAAFPVGLPAFFIQAYTDKGDLAYDPFCGSGSTLVAAEQTGRRCCGMEISPAYCDIVVERWEKLTGGKAVLAPA